MTQPNFRRYDEVRPCIGNADLLLFRRAGLTGVIIGAASRSIYSHAAMAAWWDDTLFCLEMREWIGGRGVRLSKLVDQYPGRIDVYRADLGLDERKAAVDAMRQATGVPYGWLTILWHAWRTLPVVRWFVSPPVDDRANGSPVVCSSLLARVYREAAGHDPVPNLSDRGTTPGDLARSTLFTYRWTLLPACECYSEEATR